MRTIHDAAREVLYAEVLPPLGDAGLCHLFKGMGGLVENAYSAVSAFNHDGGPRDYLGGSKGDWNDDRLNFIMILAETNPADFEPDAVSEVETLMLHGMTEEEAKDAAHNRLLTHMGPYYPHLGGITGWLWCAFFWAGTKEGHAHWRQVVARLEDNYSYPGYVSINRP